MRKALIILTTLVITATQLFAHSQPETNPADYVSTLVGTLSDHSFSTGNTYPATARPWGETDGHTDTTPT